jgi:hypothetical protein
MNNTVKLNKIVTAQHNLLGRFEVQPTDAAGMANPNLSPHDVLDSPHDVPIKSSAHP